MENLTLQYCGFLWYIHIVIWKIIQKSPQENLKMLDRGYAHDVKVGRSHRGDSHLVAGRLMMGNIVNIYCWAWMQQNSEKTILKSERADLICLLTLYVPWCDCCTCAHHSDSADMSYFAVPVLMHPTLHLDHAKIYNREEKGAALWSL